MLIPAGYLADISPDFPDIWATGTVVMILRNDNSTEQPASQKLNF